MLQIRLQLNSKTDEKDLQIIEQINAKVSVDFTQHRKVLLRIYLIFKVIETSIQYYMYHTTVTVDNKYSKSTTMDFNYIFMPSWTHKSNISRIIVWLNMLLKFVDIFEIINGFLAKSLSTSEYWITFQLLFSWTMICVKGMGMEPHGRKTVKVFNVRDSCHFHCRVIIKYKK